MQIPELLRGLPEHIRRDVEAQRWPHLGNHLAADNPTPPAPPYALLSPSGSGVGLSPLGCDYATVGESV